MNNNFGEIDFRRVLSSKSNNINEWALWKHREDMQPCMEETKPSMMNDFLESENHI